MDCVEGSRVRVLLTEEELQFPAIDDLCNKYIEWLTISKEAGSGRKTRSAIRRLDSIYEDIMGYKLPPIKLKHLSSPTIPRTEAATSSVDTSIDTDSDSSSLRPITRSLRSRSRTPTQQAQPKPLSRQPAAPATPSNQRIRAHMKQANSGLKSNGSSSVLTAALNQQHPSVSVNKIRQILRADSAQKKKLEEKERQERIMMERKAKEEKAESRKKYLLEEKAHNAKLKREARLMHAAEVRKAREENTKYLQKQKELESKKAPVVVPVVEVPKPDFIVQPTKEAVPYEELAPKKQKIVDEQPTAQTNRSQQSLHQVQPTLPPVTNINNETFKKPAEDLDNIEISIQDETTDESRDTIQRIAIWTRAPHLRDALTAQFGKPDSERHKDVLKVFPKVRLPVVLEQIFGPNKAVNNRYLCRTSSAVWSPPNRAMKRTSSMVDVTPNGKH